MPGPNSAPNGDKSLTDNTMITHDGNGKALKQPMRKRDYLASRGRLWTGKTSGSRPR